MLINKRKNSLTSFHWPKIVRQNGSLNFKVLCLVSMTLVSTKGIVCEYRCFTWKRPGSISAFLL